MTVGSLSGVGGTPSPRGLGEAVIEPSPGSGKAEGRFERKLELAPLIIPF